MKRYVLAAGLALAAAACSQPTTSSTATTAAPQGLMERTLAAAPEMRPVAATTALMAYQAAHADSTPKCTEIRESAERGIIPADVADGSIYKPFAGDLVFAVQCGPRLTTVRPDPQQHWLVVMAPGAADATVISCADAHAFDQCIGPIPRATATASTATGTTTATTRP